MRVPTTNQVIPGAFVNIVLKADQPTGRTVSGRIQDVLTRGNHPRGIKVRLSDGRVGRVQSMVSLSSSATATSTTTITTTTAVNVNEEGRVTAETTTTTRLSLDGISNDGEVEFDMSGNGDAERGWGRGRGRNRGRGRGRARGRGNRLGRDNYLDEAGAIIPAEQPAVSLEAYIRPARNQRHGSGHRGAPQSQGGTQSVSTNPPERPTPRRGDMDYIDSGDEGLPPLTGRQPGESARSEIITCPVCESFEGDKTAVEHHVAGHFGD